MNDHAVIASTPGRICLFGEHQDYLGLPVIAAAISCRIQINAERTGSGSVHLNLPDIGSYQQFDLAPLPLPYQHDRDYFRSAVNVLFREGFRFSAGIEGDVRGKIPINAGTSSSSALLISWLNVLSQLADAPRALTPHQLAELAYRAEVLEFGEPGGMMDHYSTAIGGVIYLESKPNIHLETYHPLLGTFVLGNSKEPKDTIGILSRVKHGMQRIDRQLTKLTPDFSLQHTLSDALPDYKNVLSDDDYLLLRGTFDNRDLLREALTLFKKYDTAPLDNVRFGQLLAKHHVNLRDAQRISTPKIDRMLDAAMEAGALGGKINGSGGGGCMFAYAPTRAEQVAEAIERTGGHAYIVSVDTGALSQSLPAYARESVS